VDKDQVRDFRINYQLPDYTKARIQIGFDTQEIHFFVYNPDKAMQYPEGIASLACLNAIDIEQARDLRIMARGTFNPVMKVRLDGIEVFNATVPNISTEYMIPLMPNKTLDIVFDNDYFNQTAGIDRNLYIESVTIGNAVIRSFTFDANLGIKAFDCELLRNNTNAATSNGALRVRVI
jgi:hypothetical protein